MHCMLDLLDTRPTHERLAEGASLLRGFGLPVASALWPPPQHLSSPLGDAHIRDPIRCPARQPRLLLLPVKTDRSATHLQRIQALKRIHIDDSIKMVPNFAGDKRHCAPGQSSTKAILPQ